jgi:hypothetical protein
VSLILEEGGSITKRVICIVIMVTASCWFVAGGAWGAEFCVDNATNLQNALNTAAENSQDDTIKVVQGTYSGNFSYSSSQGYGITLEGGYALGCASRVVDPANTTLDGGGSGRVLYLLNGSGGDIQVDGFTIQNGSISGGGGGIYAYSFSALATAGNVTLLNNIIQGNSATGSGEGGGAYARSASNSGTAGNITLLNNTVTGNTSGNFGGGIEAYSVSYWGPAAGSITLINNIIAGNTAADQGGGGVYASSAADSGAAGTVTLVNNTITGNNTPGASGCGGGLFFGYSGANTINCYNNIIWGNTATTTDDIFFTGIGGTAYGYNNDYHEMSGTWNGGSGNNIDADPLFVGGGDYHLRTGSPCIDTGLNSAPGIPSEDIDGDNRIIDGDGNATATVDMGADEYVPTVYHCVSSVGELTTALSTAQSNDAHDIIQVVQGTYTGNFTYSSLQGNNINVLGGYDAGCGSRVVNPANTVLDGNSFDMVLLLANGSGGNILLDGFTIQHGVGGAGGVVATSYSDTGTAGAITITNNIVTGNTADGFGGGVSAGSISDSGTGGAVTITNNTITGNEASSGGGIYARSSSGSGAAGAITLTNNTITGNDANNYGGGVYFYVDGTSGGFINAYNNIVWGNTAPTGGDINLSSTIGTANGYNNDYAVMAGRSWDNGGPTNINADPLFVDADSGNYHLRPTSPCIDTGLNSAPGIPSTDIDGNNRIIDGDKNGTATVDMGADEFVPKTIVDFDGDGNTDIPWRHKTTGQNAVWLMNGTTWSSTVRLPAVADTNWEIVGDGDFNNDGKTDILWRHKTDGRNAAWLMNETTWSSTVSLPGVADTNWVIAGTGDFNNDGRVDILWRHKTSGQNAVWLMNGTAWSSTVRLPAVADTNWEIAGAGDFNGDGETDILWRYKTSGQNAAWLMNETTWSSTVSLPGVADTNWVIAGTGDFNNDGETDILWRHKTDGRNAVWLMNGTTWSSTAQLPAVTDTNWEIAGP